MSERKPLAPELIGNGAAVVERKLVKRSEAARMLGISVSTLRRHEGDLLRPVVDSHGVHQFEEAEVRAVMVTVRRRQALAALGPTSGDVAADVFTMLDDGEHPIEIVKRLRLLPDVVTTLHEQWARMRGGLVLSADDAAELARSIRGPMPTHGAGVVRGVRQRIDALLRLDGSAACMSCREKSAIICEKCVIQARGPISTLRAKIERKIESGVRSTRFVADVVWDGTLACGDLGAPVTVRSDWYADSMEPSPIQDFLDALEPVTT